MRIGVFIVAMAAAWGCGDNTHGGSPGANSRAAEAHPAAPSEVGSTGVEGPSFEENEISSDATETETEATYEPCSGVTRVVLASEQSGGGAAIAVDETTVFYGTRRGVMSIAKNGGSPTLLAASGEPGDIVLKNGFVYWSSGGVLRTPTEGGRVEVLLDRVIANFDVDSEGIYAASWAQRRTEIVHWTAETVTVHDYPSQQLIAPSAPGDGSVYLMPLATQGAHALKRLTPADGMMQELASVDLVRDFDVVDGMVYFSEESSGSLKRVPTTGGEVRTVATFEGYPTGVRVDGRSAYVTLLSLDEELRYSGRLLRISLDGGAVCSLAEFETSAYRIATDDKYVYFATSGDSDRANGTLNRVEK